MYILSPSAEPGVKLTVELRITPLTVELILADTDPGVKLTVVWIV
jgi:hypothetical protein